MSTGNLNLDAPWGPFSRNYLGITRVLSEKRGSALDAALFVARTEPAAAVVPDNMFDYARDMVTGDRRAKVEASPERVSADYSSFGLRYHLDGASGDSVLAVFTVESDARVRCELTFHNASDQTREYVHGLGLVVADNRKNVFLKETLRPWWLPAGNYAEIDSYRKTFGLGCRQCLTRVFNWGVEEEVLAQAFGGWPGDRVSYRFTSPKPLRDGHVYFRYVKYGELDHPWELVVNGRATRFHFPRSWRIPGGGWGKNRDAYEEWGLLRVPIGEVPETDLTIELRPIDPPGNDQARIWLDGMLFSEGTLDGGEAELSPTTLIDQELSADAKVVVASATETNASFKVVVPGEPERLVQVAAEKGRMIAANGEGSLIAALRERFGFPPARSLRDANILPWSLIDHAPIQVPAGSSETVAFTITVDDPESVVRVPGNSVAQGSAPPVLQGPHAALAAGMRDALLYNVNYPIRLFGPPSHYVVPAKYFPIPYSWDGGFAAVGLATFAPDLAWRQVRFFLTDEGMDFPLLFCGSPVPTPVYALWDVFQATGDVETLASVYPGLKRTTDFYLGRSPGNVIDAFGDGMLSTYPYNYNLGIDDHPIQRHAEERHITRDGLYSIILMTQVARIVAITRDVAAVLGRDSDANAYGDDAERLTDIIENRMWDEESGLYCWLRRTAEGVEPLVVDGSAGDMSACSFLPLFAGLTSRKERLAEVMRDPERFMTPFGVSSVDMTAPYFNPRGYWNGGIWPVMQWYLWRGCLEAGELELARRVADAILNTWGESFEKERYLGEHFMISTEQMNGAPNFAGLNAALLPMRAAYYEAYRVTVPYGVTLGERVVDRDADVLSFTLTAPHLNGEERDVLVNMGRPGERYAVTVDGERRSESTADDFGHVAFRLTTSPSAMEARIARSESSS